jgi:hypothetical protein
MSVDVVGQTPIFLGGKKEEEVEKTSCSLSVFFKNNVAQITAVVGGLGLSATVVTYILVPSIAVAHFLIPGAISLTLLISAILYLVLKSKSKVEVEEKKQPIITVPLHDPFMLLSPPETIETKQSARTNRKAVTA